MVWHPQDASPSAAESRMKTPIATWRLIFSCQTLSEPLVWEIPLLIKCPADIHRRSVLISSSSMCFTKGGVSRIRGSEGVSHSNINRPAGIAVFNLDSAADGLASCQCQAIGILPMPGHQLMNPGWFRNLQWIWKFLPPAGASEISGNPWLMTSYL